MSIFHNSTRVNRLPEVRDKATAGLRSNRLKASIIKKWLCAVLCLVSVFSASGFAVPQAAHADEEGYLFDRVITWADGSTEHVQIDSDGFFILNGVKKRLVGFEDWLEADFSAGDHFWDSANQTLYQKEFAYMASKGVRLVHLNLAYTGYNQEADLDGILTLAYNNKLLIIAQEQFKWNTNNFSPNMGDLDPVDFSLGSETVSQALPKWVNKVTSYPNVVIICFECEMDGGTFGDIFPNQMYTPESCANYFAMATSIIKANTDLPIVSKLLDDQYSQSRINLQNVILPFSAVPCFDAYEDSSSVFTAKLQAMQSWAKQKGNGRQTWLLEMSSPNRNPPQATQVTKAVIDACLATNVSVLCLAPANRCNIANNSFFDTSGNPIANTDTLMANMATWQAPISQPATTLSDTYTITASAGANCSISPSGNVVINQGGNQTYTITPDAGYHVADVLVDGASVGAVASYNFTNVTANHTISASFTQNQYTLAVDVNSSGRVAKVPNQATYPSGTPVQLTATADPGSSFSGWSGDLTGSANPVTIAVDGNKTVTATFATNLTPTSGGPQKLIGSGSVSADTTEAPDYFCLSKFTAEATGAVTEIKIYCGGASNVKIGMYENNGGEPGALLNAVNTSQACVAGWNTIAFPSTAVTSGTDYWLAFIQ
ncbi:MAG: hypothetical protein WCD72_04355, partial [Dehalococcoidia bacterium]